MARRLAEALREEEFDLILGIARGGLIPTALLALSVRDILTAAVMFYEGEETLPEPVFLPFPRTPSSSASGFWWWTTSGTRGAPPGRWRCGEKPKGQG
ncbi:hypothetical protein [Thermus aquaticus]|uniref:hypothetical protein n=1 Tax=Thermus aquaticus TaxID=271 RepID=UPI000A7E6534